MSENSEQFNYGVCDPAPGGNEWKFDGLWQDEPVFPFNLRGALLVRNKYIPVVRNRLIVCREIEGGWERVDVEN